MPPPSVHVATGSGEPRRAQSLANEVRMLDFLHYDPATGMIEEDNCLCCFRETNESSRTHVRRRFQFDFRGEKYAFFGDASVSNVAACGLPQGDEGSIKFLGNDAVKALFAGHSGLVQFLGMRRI